jgi:hypothetical protein
LSEVVNRPRLSRFRGWLEDSVPIRYAGSNVGFMTSHANTVVERFLIPLVPAKNIALVT